MAAGNPSSEQLPPGFRFHPTDEELIMHYLRNQATSRPLPVSIIPEVDIYKFDPWELPGKPEFGENERYFFTPRDRKYPNGARPNRATLSGYWKATGTDKAIYSGAKFVGVKKALVFYKGRPPKGEKTDWIMHEYRQTESRGHTRKQNGSMRLDDWVLCRIYKKKHLTKAMEKKEEPSASFTMGGVNDQQMMMKFSRTCSFTNLLEMEFGSATQLLGGDSSYNNPTLDFQNNIGNFGNVLYEKPYIGQVHTHYAPDSEKLQVNQSSMNNQSILYGSQVYDSFGFER